MNIFWQLPAAVAATVAAPLTTATVIAATTVLLLISPILLLVVLDGRHTVRILLLLLGHCRYCSIRWAANGPQLVGLLGHAA